MRLMIAVADSFASDAREFWRRQLPVGLELFFPDEDGWSQAAVLVSKRAVVDAELLRLLPDVRLVQQVGRFPTFIDLAECRKRGVSVATWPLESRITVAEHAMALMLGVARSLAVGDRDTRSGAYREKGIKPVRTSETVIAWNWMALPVVELFAKNLGLLGAGEIGCEVAMRARAFGMRVSYYNRTRLPERWERQLELNYAPLNDLLAQSDFVSLHLPHNTETEGFMGRAKFERMKSGSVFINTARGGIVDEDALVEALQSGRLRGAGLDVFVEEPLPAGHRLLSLHNVLFSPHIGGGQLGGLAADLKRLFCLLGEGGHGSFVVGAIDFN